MKNSTTLFFILLISVATWTVSCEKNREVKFSGIYECAVEYHYWDMTPKNIDSNYVQELEIKQEGEMLYILGEEVPVSSVKDGQEFTKGFGQNYFSVSFINGKVHILKRSGGLGGGAGWTYIGTKRE
ncbi:MAG: hypothetical protein PHQ74_09970 [Crocinitomicaceae bacterium]|nr:hypothetical protein [Crocinitomicaceae bacterium]